MAVYNKKGLKGHSQSLETRLKISRSMNGMVKSPEHQAKITKALKGRKFPEGWYEKVSAHLRSCVKKGSENRNWKGGVTPIQEKIRKSLKYVTWRKDVFERDKYTCSNCGKVGGELNAHHIKKFYKHKELRFDINNGITLCESCHRKIHKGKEKYGE